MRHPLTNIAATIILTLGVSALISGCEPPALEEDPPPPDDEVVDDEPAQIGPAGPEELDHGGITEIPDDPELIAEGEELFTSYGCSACHAVEVDEPSPTGPSLVGVADRREPEWIARMILHPDEMLEIDPIAQDLFAEYAVPMPDQGVDVDEARALVAYLGSLPSEGEPATDEAAQTEKTDSDEALEAETAPDSEP